MWVFFFNFYITKLPSFVGYLGFYCIYILDTKFLFFG